MALSERDLAQQEVVFELGPFLARGSAHLAERAGFAAAFDEVLVGGDDLFGKDGGVAAAHGELRAARRRPADSSVVDLAQRRP
ncbi:hypothetical protein AB0P21_39120 [Kribbella sp. NPDC056861]|uniref:hypothetical protein n=1 Tax=Kribbella sp. NPDC056861 TaxID=3154857 RepID=UPI00343964B9